VAEEEDAASSEDNIGKGVTAITTNSKILYTVLSFSSQNSVLWDAFPLNIGLYQGNA
jgi:hypothetical protein